MISIKNQIPDIYYDASRDFQILGHLYEVALNYVKTNADMLYLLPNGIEEDTRATELLATTLGFKLRRNYDKAQLAALVSIFPQLLKMKGTLKAVNLAGDALVKASGVPGMFASEINDHVLTIKIPIELSDITLFIDLLPYILPFGLRVNIVRNTVIKRELTTSVGATSVMRIAFPGNEQFVERHPLGLTNVVSSEGNLAIEYSDYSFINSDKYSHTAFNDNTVISGQLGALPIIALEPSEYDSRVQIANEEENI
jgi:hypothetical protein